MQNNHNSFFEVNYYICSSTLKFKIAIIKLSVMLDLLTFVVTGGNDENIWVTQVLRWLFTASEVLIGWIVLETLSPDTFPKLMMRLSHPLHAAIGSLCRRERGTSYFSLQRSFFTIWGTFNMNNQVPHYECFETVWKWLLLSQFLKDPASPSPPPLWLPAFHGAFECGQSDEYKHFISIAVGQHVLRTSSDRP